MRISLRFSLMIMLLGFLILFTISSNIVISNAGSPVPSLSRNSAGPLQDASDVTNMQAELWGYQSDTSVNGNDSIHFILSFDVSPETDTTYDVSATFMFSNQSGQITEYYCQYWYYRQITADSIQSVNVTIDMPAPVTGDVNVAVDVGVYSSSTNKYTAISFQYDLTTVKNSYFDSFTVNLTTMPIDFNGDSIVDGVDLIVNVTSDPFMYSPSEVYSYGYSHTVYDIDVTVYELRDGGKAFADLFYGSGNASLTSSSTEFQFFPPHNGTYEVQVQINFYGLNVTSNTFTLTNLTRSSWYYDQPRDLRAEPLDTDSDSYLDTMKFTFTAYPQNEVQAKLYYAITMDVYSYDTSSSTYVYEKTMYTSFWPDSYHYAKTKAFYYVMPDNAPQQSMTYMFNITIQAGNNYAFLENHVYYQTLSKPMKSFDSVEWDLAGFISQSTGLLNDTINLDSYLNGMINANTNSITVDFTYTIYLLNTTTGHYSMILDKTSTYTSVTGYYFYVWDSFTFTALEQGMYLINVTLSIDGMNYGNLTMTVTLDASPLGVNVDVTMNSLFGFDSDNNGFLDSVQADLTIDTLNTPLPLDLTFNMEIYKYVESEGSYDYYDTVSFTYTFTDRITTISLIHTFTETGKYTIFIYWTVDNTNYNYVDYNDVTINDEALSTTITTTTPTATSTTPIESNSSNTAPPLPLPTLSFPSILSLLSFIAIFIHRKSTRK